MNGNPALIDSNVLVYAFDSDSGEKHPVAEALLSRCWKREERYVVSTQNLAEFSVVVREKASRPTPPSDVQLFLESIVRFRGWDVIPYGPSTILRAHEIHDEFGLHFWDALLAATMEEHAVRRIFTEDSHFRAIPWLTVINPFSADGE